MAGSISPAEKSVAIVTTPVDGTYLFTGLEPGSYVVEVLTPLGYAPAAGYPIEVPISLAPGDTVIVDVDEETEKLFFSSLGEPVPAENIQSVESKG